MALTGEDNSFCFHSLLWFQQNVFTVEVFRVVGTQPTKSPRHLPEDCFLNKEKYKAGFTARLMLKKGPVSSIPGLLQQISKLQHIWVLSVFIFCIDNQKAVNRGQHMHSSLDEESHKAAIYNYNISFNGNNGNGIHLPFPPQIQLLSYRLKCSKGTIKIRFSYRLQHPCLCFQARQLAQSHSAMLGCPDRHHMARWMNVYGGSSHSHSSMCCIVCWPLSVQPWRCSTPTVSGRAK